VASRNRPNEDTEFIQELKDKNASPELIAQFEVRHKRESDDFLVLPENWPIVQLFEKVNSQWRFGGMGSLLGLDYNAVDVCIRYLQIPVDADCFSGLQIMEQVIVAEMNKRG